MKTRRQAAISYWISVITDYQNSNTITLTKLTPHISDDYDI
jgi:hypothetical protein